jgi:hypothetical protein
VFLATDFGPFPWKPLLALTTRVVGRRNVGNVVITVA